MRKTRRTTARKARRWKVGDRVRFRFGDRRIRGTIIEDRGNLATGGRRLYRIRFRFDLDPDAIIELPEHLLQVA